MSITTQDEGYMRQAIAIATERGTDPSLSPIGAVIVLDGRTIAVERNRTDELFDATAHAEMMAFRAAGKETGNMELRDATLYTTLQPCGMCTMASIWSKVGRIVYGAGREDVAGARALSPNLGDRMIAARLLDRSVFIRELAPQDLKLEVEQFTEAQAVKAARYLAYVVGKAHVRQMDSGTRAAWRRVLLDHRRTSIEAPSWLWDAVVDLAGSHEQGYLQHCRRYALRGAA